MVYIGVLEHCGRKLIERHERCARSDNDDCVLNEPLATNFELSKYQGDITDDRSDHNGVKKSSSMP